MGVTQAIELKVNGELIHLEIDSNTSLLEVLRHQLRLTSVKDGCSPQGQCGCCTVLVDGTPRVSCVTPARRVQNRSITTLEGFKPEVREAWLDAFVLTGASQCGFCTPGIICRYEGLRAKGLDHCDRVAAAKALQAHLCRCTGWQTIVDAWQSYGDNRDNRDNRDRDRGSSQTGDLTSTRQRRAATQRACIEGGVAQAVGSTVAAGQGGFAADTAPKDALVAVLAHDQRVDSSRCNKTLETSEPSAGEYWIAGQRWVLGETHEHALRLANKVGGRRTTATFEPPIPLPAGCFDLTLQTSWVEPAYLETDTSWCRPGGQPCSPLANGGAFGAKTDSKVSEVAQQLANAIGKPVEVCYSREDTVRCGPKRPPIAAGINRDGSGVMHVARTPGIRAAIAKVAPQLQVLEVEVEGPPTSSAIRGAGWVEAVVLLAGVCNEMSWLRAPGGGEATATVNNDNSLAVQVRCGAHLDETVLRSYCIGAAHMALSWVCSEKLTVDDEGIPHDLTIRSFGVLPALATPPIEINIEASNDKPVNGSDAVFAAVAAAVWRKHGCPPTWPICAGETASGLR